ncbi:MAG: hypothetical protein MZW92_26925 [Comamonadaceae bacterium]|nr:hypothetical protein [Comamonadaceae bacterium]
MFIFSKDDKTGEVFIKRPDIETYGTTFDAILEECFGVRPPISQVPREDIKELMTSAYDPEAIKAGIMRLVAAPWRKFSLLIGCASSPSRRGRSVLFGYPVEAAPENWFA